MFRFKMETKRFIDLVLGWILLGWATLFTIDVIRVFLEGKDGIVIYMDSFGEMFAEMVLMIVIVIYFGAKMVWELIYFDRPFLRKNPLSSKKYNENFWQAIAYSNWKYDSDACYAISNNVVYLTMEREVERDTPEDMGPVVTGSYSILVRVGET